jgi:hypothetical protein
VKCKPFPPPKEDDHVNSINAKVVVVVLVVQCVCVVVVVFLCDFNGVLCLCGAIQEWHVEYSYAWLMSCICHQATGVTCRCQMKTILFPSPLSLHGSGWASSHDLGGPWHCPSSLCTLIYTHTQFPLICWPMFEEFISAVFATLETDCIFRAFPIHTEVKWPIHYILDEVGTYGSQQMPNTILAYR